MWRVRSTTSDPSWSRPGMLRTPTSLPTFRDAHRGPAALRSVVWTVRTTPSRSTVTANAGTGPTGPVVSSPPTIRTARGHGGDDEEDEEERSSRWERSDRHRRRVRGDAGGTCPLASSGIVSRVSGSGTGSQVAGSCGSARAGDGATAASTAAAASRDDGLGVGRVGRADVGGWREQLVERRKGVDVVGERQPRRGVVRLGAAPATARRASSSERSSSAGRSDGSGTGSHASGRTAPRAGDWRTECAT